MMEYYLLVRHQICLAFFNFMKKEIVTFEYEGIEIQFGVGEAVWLNATEIAKKYGKLISGWTRNTSTEEYILALKTRYAKSHNGENKEFLMTSQGGSMQGTWIHQKLAIRFAQWLNPNFAVWVDEKIEELLTKGEASTGPKLPTNFIEALKALVVSEEARMIAEAQAEENQEKAEIVDLIVETGDNYTMQQAANVLGSGRKDFFTWLRANNYLQSNNEPYQKYIRQSPFFVVKERPKDGHVYHTPFVTPRGLAYFAKKFSKINKSSKTLDTNIIK